MAENTQHSKYEGGESCDTMVIGKQDLESLHIIYFLGATPTLDLNPKNCGRVHRPPDTIAHIGGMTILEPLC